MKTLTGTVNTMTSTQDVSKIEKSMPTAAKTPTKGSKIQDATDPGPPEKKTPLLKNQTHMISILPGYTETAASFEFLEEDHTLGNALRWIVSRKYAAKYSLLATPV